MASKPTAPGGVKATPTSRPQPAPQARPARPGGRPSAEVPQEAGGPSGPPRWLQIVSLALAIAGLGVSAYETYAHFNGSRLLGCPTGGHGTFNCTAVITSPQSMVFGVIPVAILGLAFYVFVVAIMTPWAWQAQRREVAWLRLGSMIVGMGFVMYLIYAELYQIGEICEYCTGVHAITFLLFCITVVSAALWGLGKPKPAE
ncbi:vitamin K epoxide reductase family protein [Trebonia sp.]|uniref:vitamin K epoxide reductase family protein n=1 Tax=Trebonia sp. TaxID=2767075 RepID=UPI00261DFD38|nr:vitamin K epoxide reductase family protein [Trebonia sp.]